MLSAPIHCIYANIAAGLDGEMWDEDLERALMAREGIADAIEALREMEGEADLAELLADALERVERLAGRYRERIERRDAREARALEREYRKGLM